MASFIKLQHFETYPGVSPARLVGEFSRRTVLLTGGGSGIGATIARSFAEANTAKLILIGRTESTLKETSTVLRTEFPGLDVTYHVADISAPEQLAEVFTAIGSSPDVLVNNAGYLPEPGSFVDADLKDWWQAFQINVLGTATVTQMYLRHRRAQSTSTPGVIVNINTRAAFETHLPGLSGYGASKAAILRLAEAITDDVPASEARVISIHPGAVKSAMLTKSKLNRPLTDVKLAADFVVWTASSKAAFLNGRFVWVNWDVEELESWKDVIIDRDLLRTSIKEV
ncbi:short-chain dehydrogenase [Colletotrichum truncatum]|uniref:Short-chain dehydrogenase n=1 Tax=Colletotrichum truncatum TaxID=5467 RepID=A0ACC3YS28_COLTU|nr:short-chain dehydrogenase [Colletotrichum truncatum]KAF6789956.1 short-chain dehydrogenase [Colletotrichum truncatum]